MSAPTTTTTTTTAAALARLAAITPAPDLGPGNELTPWLAAAAAGSFELPAPILDVVTMAAHLAEQSAANVRPGAHHAGDVKRILHGAAVDDVIAADGAHRAALARHDERERLLLAARRLLQGTINEAFTPTRDNLIRGELREAVAGIIGKAGKAAEKLGRFAPGYHEGELLGAGTAKELDVWRESRQLQRDFEVLITAWLTSWGAATGRQQAVGREYAPQRAGGYYCWLSPDDVVDEDVRLGRDVDVLRLSTAPSTYRLLAPSELMPLIDTITAGLPEGAPKPASQIVRQSMVAT